MNPEDKVRIATFEIGAVSAIGHTAIDGENTTVHLSSNEFYGFSPKEERRIHGTLTDHTKITLIDCVTTSTGSNRTANGRSFQASVFPHYIVTGSRHVEPEEPNVTAIELLISNAHVLFWDCGAFGCSIGDRDTNRSFIQQLASPTHDKPAVGDYPEIFYFTGKHSILSAQTIIGLVSVSHRPTITSPSPEGIQVRNSIPIRIVFEAPLTFHDAFTRAYTLLVFVDLIMGTEHRMVSSTIELTTPSETKVRLDVYQTMAPHAEGKKDSERPQPGDVLINGGMQPASFSAVLTAWLTRQTDWASARFRFAQNFRKHNNYSVDRLVAAANLFDILPESAVGGTPSISSALSEATAEAKRLFRRLPPSQERDSVLGALGRVGKHNLRAKVAHRTKRITDKIGERFPDLDLATATAISVRNYFVHGSETKLSQEHCVELSPFFTDTLEFIFGASDLIEAGWDIEKWNASPTGLSHPFSRYRASYGENLADLKAKLALSENTTTR